MKRIICILSMLLCMAAETVMAARAPVSEATEECLGCHSSIHPGIVEEWQNSRHARITPREALGVTGLARKVSARTVPDYLLPTAVGCAECHTLNAKVHADTFEHNGVSIHLAVSPRDCATCHTEEAVRYSGNLMAHARKNLAANPLYQDLQQQILGRPVRREGKLTFEPPAAETRQSGCFYCHGTRLEVVGMETRDTVLGEMEFPRLSGWPNQGVGRVNTDGSLGSCAACHTRHAFSIEMARKPHTCRECHVGPDVPAYKVYASSKHGNIYAAMNRQWDFSAVPWTVGKDFTAPTCATCHISLVVNTDGQVLARRTHEMSGRLAWRIFGLIYAHPHPMNPDTTRIRNKSGQPLPTDFDGTYAAEYLIDAGEQVRRTETMQAICLGCHSASWVRGHWKRFERTIRETRSDIRAATGIMADIWARGFAKGPDSDDSPFNEAIERTWCDAWLFYANTVRFSAAMAGGGDYSVFADGRYQLSRRIQELNDWLELRNQLFPPTPPIALRGLPEKPYRVQ
ncbi:hydroxylamine oxidase [Desulfonema ishimotonii]|uniref:Hydroxylamine oxidase n=1 Tax=Desulfonema ishimotonii TaxID=45657 RepID=A0A401G1I7_9BACT|nr:multiheme c-type cytochrome [Desulfonema ishimotonii]GBC63082.1 hydroxylamine oxidase [Desulfonema ishimotonii]